MMTILDENPPESDRALVTAAVAACPVQAIDLGGRPDQGPVDTAPVPR